MPKPRIEDCERVLVVEGYSDLLFYAEMLEHLGRLKGVFIKDMGGKANLPTKLESLLRPDLQRAKAAIGVVCDADGNPAAVLESDPWIGRATAAPRR